MENTEENTQEFSCKYHGKELKFSLPCPPEEVEGGETDIDECYVGKNGEADHRYYCYENAVREDMFLHLWRWFVDGDGISEDDLETLLGTRGEESLRKLKDRERDDMQDDYNITGAGNGSYFMWITDAQKALIWNDDLLREALDSTGERYQNAVKADMLIRQYLVDKYFDEIWDFFVSELRGKISAQS